MSFFQISNTAVNASLVLVAQVANKERESGNNGFRKNHVGRLIVGMDTTYYVITRQYRCYDCERKRNDLCGSTAMEAALRESGVSVEKTVDKLEYTFMAWDKRIIPLYPYGIGMDFPAILTWRAGVDKLVVYDATTL